MPALFVFLLKVNVALIVFCVGYYLVLRKLTFYTLNRIYLVSAIIFSSVYPLIDVNDFMLRHQEIATPVQNVAINWQAPQQFIEQPGYWQWVTAIFWIGAAVFAVRLMIQLLSLLKLYRNSSPATIQEHEVRVTNANISPFSFWKNIYINPANIEAADLKSVIQHEQVHVTEWHTLDILLAELSTIFYWFNPGVWLMKRAVRENIEFITDRKILQLGADSKAYQYSLLHVSIAATASAGITNHFNFSTLKKRIKMMNTKKSSNLNLTRYAVLVPMVIVLLLIFSFSKAEVIKENRRQLTNIIAATIGADIDEPKKVETPIAAVNIKKTKPKTKAVADTTKKETKKIRYITISDTATPGEGRFEFFPDGKSTDSVIKTMIMRRSNHPDSAEYYVNGRKVGKEEFIKIAPKGINGADVLVGTGTSSEVRAIRINGKTHDLSPDMKYTFKTDDRDTVKFKGNVTYSFTPKNTYTFVTKSDVFDNKTQTTTIAGRLTIIDDKEATEKDLKKLPASEIDKITVKDGKAMTDKYGEKAKNGVLFITTKKGK